MAERFSTKKLVLFALLAALACMAIMSIRTFTFGTGGYIHLGDAVTTPCGVFLDPVSAFLAAGISSYMADLLGGYLIYVPITFVIKGLVVFSASHAYRSLRVRGISPYTVVAGCGVIDIILVAGGYCMREAFLYGLGTVLAGAPSSIIQRISDLIIPSALYPALQKPLSMTLKV